MPGGHESTRLERLGEIAGHLRRAFVVPETQEPKLTDLLFALENPAVRAAYRDIRFVRRAQQERLGRVLARHAANEG